MGTDKRGLGFTLVELLIVVSIIAILAVIATPNFLEAQARAKVSRSKADMKALATAIEAYAVDWNRYPLYGVLNNDGSMQSPHRTPTGAPAHKFLFEGLTTPVAYVSSLLDDTFLARTGPPQPTWAAYWYRPFYTNLNQFECAMKPAVVPSIDQKRKMYGIWILSESGPDRDRLDLARDVYYDPTNGTISDGDIVRSPKITN